MVIVNFILFALCCAFATGFCISCLLMAPWLAFFFAVFFILGYYAFRLNPNEVTVEGPKEIRITHIIEGQKEEDDDDFNSLLYRNNINLN
jgi:hypothetical protein